MMGLFTKTIIRTIYTIWSVFAAVRLIGIWYVLYETNLALGIVTLPIDFLLLFSLCYGWGWYGNGEDDRGDIWFNLHISVVFDIKSRFSDNDYSNWDVSLSKLCIIT